MRTAGFFLVGLVVFSMACSHSRRPGEPTGRRGGTNPYGAPEDNSDGTITVSGSGDAGTGSASGSGGGSGPIETDPVVCESDYVEPAIGAYCSSTTATCINNCLDNDCAVACLDADPNPDCSTCINVNFIACGNTYGCQGAWDDYTCCIETECGAEPSDACAGAAADGACSFAWDGYNTCLDGVDFETYCPNVVADCFG